jgi:hypothetical protein
MASRLQLNKYPQRAGLPFPGQGVLPFLDDQTAGLKNLSEDSQEK